MGYTAQDLLDRFTTPYAPASTPSSPDSLPDGFGIQVYFPESGEDGVGTQAVATFAVGTGGTV